MKKIAFLAMAAVCISLQIRAQNWNPGSVVLASGDTLTGELSTSEIAKYKCKFLKADGSTTTYTPDQVRSFFIPGVIYFESVMLKRDQETLTVFANVRVSGKADLLEFEESFYLRDGDVLYALESIQQEKEVNGRDYVVTREIYKQTLKDKLVDCPATQNLINSTRLTRKSLTKLFIKYNSCFGGDIEVRSQRKVQLPYFSLGVEYNFMRTRLQSVSSRHGIDADESTFDDKIKQNIPGLYLQYNAGAPAGLALQLSFHKVSYHFRSHSAFEDITYPPDGGTRTIDVDHVHEVSYSSFVTPITIRYSFFNRSYVRPFIATGLGLQFNKDFTTSREFTNITDGTYKKEPIPLSKIDPVGLAFNYGFGINLHIDPLRVGISLNWEYLAMPVTFIALGGGVGVTMFGAKQVNFSPTLSVGYAFTR